MKTATFSNSSFNLYASCLLLVQSWFNTLIPMQSDDESSFPSL